MSTLRRLGAVVVTVLPVLALAACGTGSVSTGTPHSTGAIVPQLKPSQKVSITFESYNLAIAGPWQDTFNTLIADFEKKYPNITVTAQKPGNVTASSGVSNSVASVENEVAAGDPPDVAQETFGDLNFMVSKIRAENLDSVAGKAAVQANFGGTYPFAPTARTLGNVNGSTYAVPFVFSTPVLFYNATLFKKAGLDPSKPPATWAEVKADALAIHKRTGAYGAYVDCLTQVSGDWCYQALVGSNGGSVITPNDSRLTFADPAAVQAVAMGQDLVNSGAMPKLTQAQAYPDFAAGKGGMILESSALQAVFAQGAAAGKWDLMDAPMPSFNGKPTAPTNSGAALFMLAKTPAKQRAAWDLIKFLTSPQAYTLISSKIGYLPLRTGLVNDPNGLQQWAQQQPLLKANLDQLARLRPWVSFPGDNYVQIRNDMMQAVEQVVYHDANPTSTLSAAQSQASQYLPHA